MAAELSALAGKLVVAVDGGTESVRVALIDAAAGTVMVLVEGGSATACWQLLMTLPTPRAAGGPALPRTMPRTRFYASTW